MGIFDEIKAFVHSITTDDHYASYDSPYKNSVINNSGNVVGGRTGESGTNGTANNGSRLHELNRLTNINNSSNSSLIDGATAPNVGYRPGFRSSSSNFNSTTDLSMQNLNSQGQPPLPSIDSLWDRIELWIEEEYPELEDCLNYGVTTADLNEFENDLGCGALPNEFRQFYKRHDGQFRGGKPTGIIMGLALLDLEGIVEEHHIWSKVADRLERQQHLAQQEQFQQQQASSSAAAPESKATGFMANQRSIPPNAIQSYYYHKGWVPLLKDETGNQIALDVSPGPSGNWGQVIIFGRDYDTKLVIASSFAEFIFQVVTDFDKENYEIDSEQMNEDMGFLSSDRNDEYMIGDEDEDQGELSYYDRDGKEFGKGAFKGRVSYIEILKRRALKKYGLTTNFNTAFTPPRAAKKQQPRKATSGASTPLRSSTPPPAASKEALINLESKVNLPKETLIDKAKETNEEIDLTDIKEEIVKIEPKAEVSELIKEPESKHEPFKSEELEHEEPELDVLQEVKQPKKSKKQSKKNAKKELKESKKEVPVNDEEFAKVDLETKDETKAGESKVDEVIEISD